MTVIVWVVDHHGPVMKVYRQHKGLTENPVNDCSRLWLAPLPHLTLGEADIVPGGEISVEINAFGIQSSRLFVAATTLTLFTDFEPFV